MKTFPENMNLTLAAQYLGVAPITIRRMLKDKEIPAAKLRGRWLFQKNVIDQWLAKNSWSRVNGTVANKHKQAATPDSKKMHPSVALLYEMVYNFDFSDLDPADWDEAQKVIAEDRARSMKESQRIAELAERGE